MSKGRLVDCCEGFSMMRYSWAFSEGRVWGLGGDLRSSGELGIGVGR